MYHPFPFLEGCRPTGLWASAIGELSGPALMVCIVVFGCGFPLDPYEPNSLEHWKILPHSLLAQ